MQIQLNGKPFNVSGPSLAALLQALDLGPKRYAVEVNEELIPRAEHATYQLQEGDRIEVVQAIGGG